MATSRRSLVWLASLSGAASLLLVFGIARRVSGFNRDHPPQIFAFKEITEPEFTFNARPVTIADDRSQPEHPHVVIAFDSAELRLRVPQPVDYRLPKLVPHRDWMRVLAFVPASGEVQRAYLDNLASHPDAYRLVVVTRTSRAGVDPKTWGAAWQRDWVFDFHEFQREGGFTQERLRYPTRGGMKRPKEGELRENTWQFQAALQMMPKAGGVGPTHNFFGNALSAAGWMLPAAAFSGAICTFATAFAAGPHRRRPSPASTPSAAV